MTRPARSWIRDGGRPGWRLPPAWRSRLALFGPAGLALALELAVALRYGYFRDELYYLACAEHPAWGYVDHPPLSVGLLILVRGLLGDGLLALRLLPALSVSATVLAVGLLARRFGAGSFGVAVGGLAATFSCYLGIGHVYSMNAFDLLVWSYGTLLLLSALEEPRPRTWMALGALLGLGLLNKVSVLWFGAGALIGIVAVRRRVLATPWPWAAAALALLLFTPHLLWQSANGWPTLEFMRNARELKMVGVGPGELLLGQVLAMNPLHVPIWVAGLLAGLFSPRLRAARAPAWIWITTATILIASGSSRVTYLALAYPGILAAGAVTLERALARRPLTRTVVLAIMLLWGGALVPAILPVLPPSSYARYAGFLGLQAPAEERQEMGVLPQHFADQLGWDEMAHAVAAAWEGLAPEERERAVIFAGNYGRAGAVDLFGRRLGLPGAISGHNSYWLWGPGDRPGDVAVLLGGTPESYAGVFASVEQVGVVHNPLAMPYERDLSVLVGRGLLEPLDLLWPRLKHYR